MSLPQSISRPVHDDVVGRYFAALARRGSPCLVPFAIVHSDGDVRWSVHDHALEDGIGILATQLETEGSAVPPLPARPQAQTPGTFAALRHVAQYLRASETRQEPWAKSWNAKAAPCDWLSWAVLDKQTTAHLVEFCEETSISLNSLLLWGLHQTPALWNGGRPISGVWGVPVNLRGPVQLSNPRANHVSEMPVRVPHDASPTAVHQSIRQGLREGRYWGPWWVLQQVGRLPDTGLDRFAALRASRAPEHRLGGLSFLGHWSGSDDVAGRVFAPPVDANLPIGGGALVYNDQLSLGVRIHGALASTGLHPRDVLARWLSVMGTCCDTTLRPAHHASVERAN